MTSNIYMITDRTNNKVYVGQTKRDIYKRFAEHIYRALNSDRKNDKAVALYIAINNHKPENFYVELLEKVEGTPKDIDEREVFWISEKDSTNPDVGYNLDKGGHVISDACRKAAEKHLFKAGDKLEGKMLENARNNGYKVAKKVCQFDKDGTYIKTYPSVIEASRATGCDRRSIQRQVNDNRYKDFNSRSISNIKYVWAYEEDVTKCDDKFIYEKLMNYLSPSVEDTFEKYANIRSKKVIAEYVYSEGKTLLEGIKVFGSIKECAEFFNINKDTVTKYCNSGEWCEKCDASFSYYNE